MMHPSRTKIDEILFDKEGREIGANGPLEEDEHCSIIQNINNNKKKTTNKQ